MKKIVFVICSIFLISAYATAKSTKSYKKNNSKNNKTIPADTEDYKYIEYENGYFIISWIPYEYKLSNDNYHSYSTLKIRYKTLDSEEQKNIKQEGSYFQINGQTLKINFIPDNEFIEINESGRYVFKKDGIGKVNIQIGESITSYVEITQITLPLNSNDTKDALIEKIGFADSDKIHIIKWPDKITIDGIWYDTTKKIKDIYVTHYFYKKYPYLCISYATSGFYRCGTTRDWKENF